MERIKLILIVTLLLNIFSSQGLRAKEIEETTFYALDFGRTEDWWSFQQKQEKNSPIKNFINSDKAGEVLLLGNYSPNLKTILQEKKQHPKAKVHQLKTSPKYHRPELEISIYTLYSGYTEDSSYGEAWVKWKNQWSKIADNVLLGYVSPMRSNFFTIIGSSKEGQLAYCWDDCFILDLKSGHKEPKNLENNPEEPNISQTVQSRLIKEKSTCPTSPYDLLKTFKNQAYYRKFCGEKKKNQILEVRLKKEKSNWKITDWDWSF